MSTEELVSEITKIIERIEKPERAVITAGMPYANGPLHIGHLAGTIIPADIYARWMRLLIGEDNTLFVFGTDDHGSNSDLSAKKAGKSVQSYISEIHDRQSETLDAYQVARDIYAGTSREDVLPIHAKFCQNRLRSLHENGMLEKKSTMQWYDPSENMFLPDRFVKGTCPSCGAEGAYSTECDTCGSSYDCSELINPISQISGHTPTLKATDHWWLNMWKVGDLLKQWIESKKRNWRKQLIGESIDTVTPRIIFSNKHEETYKALKAELPKHKSRYAPGKKIVCLFDNITDLETSKDALMERGIDVEIDNSWALRSITRDISWGIPVPDIDPSMKDKTLYVWPDSLYAPVSFTQAALKKKNLDPSRYKEWWENPKAGIYQFLGQDNNFFYVVMQGALWLGSQKDSAQMPQNGDLQLTDIFSCFHLQIENQKMSKSTGNSLTGAELLQRGYSSDQLRYFFSLLSLTEKPSNFEFKTLEERNKFLAGPLNAAFEKPLSAAEKHYNGKIPQGELIGKTEKETKKVIQIYVNGMKKAEYSKLLFALENYARVINGLFTQYKPHDDRYPEKDRSNALYSSFYILKNIVILLSPFAPETMEKLRGCLNLPKDVYALEELTKPIQANHAVNAKVEFFPAVEN